MHVPATTTTTTPALGASLVRMGSIPHGTTSNAQTLEYHPFVIGTDPPKLMIFASQTAANSDTRRIPQDLTKFIAAETITRSVLTDPHTVLRDAIVDQTIAETIVFTGSTPQLPE